jgi:hypothetical protein
MKTSEFAVALVVILVAASAIGGMLYYFRNTNSTPQTVVQTTSSSGQSVQTTHSSTPTHSTEGLQETGSVNSVDSAGGHYSISNVALSNPLMVALSQNELSQVQYGEDFQVQMTYSPNQQSMLSTFGKVIGVSSNADCTTAGAYTPEPCATIALLNTNIPSTVPSNWNPQVGGQVTLALTPETETPLVAITGAQFSSTGSQASAEVLEPTCLTQYSGTNACVMLANGQSFMIEVFISGSTCYGSCEPSSITAGDPGFTVTGFGPASGGFTPDTNITMLVPNTDFVGNIDLTLVYASS